MKVAIRYYTRTGNTEKLAKKLGEAIKMEAKNITNPLVEDVDILFLGSSVYAAGVDDEIKKFIENINVKVGRVVNFSTAAILKSTSKQVKKLLANKNIIMDDKEFFCKGSFGILHKGKPNDKDLNDIAEFAKNIINN